MPTQAYGSSSKIQKQSRRNRHVSISQLATSVFACRTPIAAPEPQANAASHHRSPPPLRHSSLSLHFDHLGKFAFENDTSAMSPQSSWVAVAGGTAAVFSAMTGLAPRVDGHMYVMAPVSRQYHNSQVFQDQ